MGDHVNKTISTKQSVYFMKVNLNYALIVAIRLNQLWNKFSLLCGDSSHCIESTVITDMIDGQKVTHCTVKLVLLSVNVK